MIVPAPRIFAILPRAGVLAAVLRRGPADAVQLIQWNLATDTFVMGQWLRGRIYERRADLSPSGKRLIYFAGNQKLPFRTWTAISKPPYLRAIVLWPNGSTWGGGGLFADEDVILLNQSSELAESFTLPNHVQVKSAQLQRWNEEGFGIYRARLERDGWTPVMVPEKQFGPTIFNKHFCLADGREFELEMDLAGGEGRTDCSFHLKNLHAVVDGRASSFADQLFIADWADIDPAGDLLFAAEGCLFRLKPEVGSSLPYDLSRARLLYNFCDAQFEAFAAPEEASLWD